MNTNLLFDFTISKETNTVNVKREFEADLALVWDAFTTRELLEKWWAPKPWHVETKSMDFREGGRWLYAMVSPENQKFWCRVDFKTVVTGKSFSHENQFCDENGTLNPEFPQSQWSNVFSEKDGRTTVSVTIKHEKLADLEKMLAMGFQGGFTMTLGQLEEYLKAGFRLRSENKTNTVPRVSTYLNFAGNTEEAFLFYRSVFKTEFVGKGIQRFGDIPAGADVPPITDSIKKMILHVQLPITGGHILMGTDAPKEMGFDLVRGNNMHINVEPDTREETKRIFDALAHGGTISMPLKDMFFGSYYGAVQDRYGINWMVNHQNHQ